MSETLVAPWQPLKWKPAYDLMVSMHVCGYSNVEIARQVDYHPVQVGNILRSDEARTIIAEQRKLLLTKMAEDVPTQLEQMRQKAFSRIHNVLNDEDLATKSPFAVASTAMGFLKGIGSLNDGSTKVQNNTVVNMPVSKEHMADLISALKESQSLESIPDAEFERIDSGGESGILKLTPGSKTNNTVKKAS